MPVEIIVSRYEVVSETKNFFRGYLQIQLKRTLGILLFIDIENPKEMICSLLQSLLLAILF